MDADAEDELSELEPSKAYIIGGIVDRNRYKGLCWTKAESDGIKTARLPIGEYVKLHAAPVMTVNQVMHTLCPELFHTQCGLRGRFPVCMGITHACVNGCPVSALVAKVQLKDAQIRDVCFIACSAWLF